MADAAPIPAWTRSRATFVLFGDSITELGWEDGGWATKLANLYGRKADVINRGFSGYNTRWCKLILDDVLPVRSPSDAPAPALVVIFLGANDAALPAVHQHQHVPLEEYVTNMRALAERALSNGSKVLLVAPPPIFRDARLRFQVEKFGDRATGVPERTNEFTGTYAKACVELAAELRVPCVDAWTAFQEVPDWESLLSDGLHFSATGQAKMFELVAGAVERNFPDLAPDAMPSQFPPWADVKWEDPASSLAAK